MKGSSRCSEGAEIDRTVRAHACGGSLKTLGSAVAVSSDTACRKVSFRPAVKENGAPGGIRTHDPCLRRAVLYPAELLVQRGAIILICVSLVHAADSSGVSYRVMGY